MHNSGSGSAAPTLPKHIMGTEEGDGGADGSDYNDDEGGGAASTPSNGNGTSTAAADATNEPPPTPTHGRGMWSVPEPPRWRFVAEAKKTSGYSSVAAGTVVEGEQV